ncbi:dual specificity protein kinase CLK2b isoform X1 [Festucalex cinctus]
MFYYPAVLKRGTGCFSTVWLAATRGITVPRREFLKVNVKSTCDDIINYILVKVPPPHANLPRPRFSLYLSSQLQYGVVVVFHRQCVIFLKELQDIVNQLLKKSRSKELDLKDPGRQVTDLQPLLDEIDGVLDPLFGEMDQFRPSPSALMQMEEIPEQRASSAEREPTPARSASPMSRITASSEDITMKEPTDILVPEFSGQDLDDNVEETLEALLAQTDNILTDLLRPEEAPTAEAEVEGAPARQPTPATEATATALEAGPTTVSSRDQDLILPPQDETPGMPRPIAHEGTPVGAPPPVSSSRTAAAQEPAVAGTEGAPHPEETEPKRKKRRTVGRQLIFFDPNTQIPHEELQQQIRDPLLETRHRPFLPPESHRLKTARELLSAPCVALPEDLLFLWTQASAIAPIDDTQLPPSGGGVESSSSEEGRQVEPDSSAAEVPRDGAEADVVQVSDIGSLPLEASGQRESSREVSPLLPQDQESWSRSGVKLPDVAEMPEGLPEEFVGLEEKTLLFHSLLPPEADRRSVSNLFQNLLDILATGKICADQEEPYGDIVIQPGPNYNV